MHRRRILARRATRSSTRATPTTRARSTLRFRLTLPPGAPSATSSTDSFASRRTLRSFPDSRASWDVSTRRTDLYVSPQNRRKVPRRTPIQARRTSSRAFSACSTRRQRADADGRSIRSPARKTTPTGKREVVSGLTAPNDTTVVIRLDGAVRDFPETPGDACRGDRSRLSSGEFRRASRSVPVPGSSSNGSTTTT